MTKTIFVFFLACVSHHAFCQQQSFQQHLYWIRFQTQWTLSPKMYWNNEVDNRRFFDPDVQNQLIFHSRLHYKTGPWDVAGGLTLSYAFAQFPERGYDHVTTEIRPVAEISHEVSVGAVSLQNRFRIDNRFFQVNEDESIWEDLHGH